MGYLLAQLIQLVYVQLLVKLSHYQNKNLNSIKINLIILKFQFNKSEK